MHATMTSTRQMGADADDAEKYGKSVSMMVSLTRVSKQWKTYPQSQRPTQFATTIEMVPASCPASMKLSGITRGRLCAMLIIPATVKPDGPTDMNIAGRDLSIGSFCVISRYKKAEYTISETMNPMPCKVNPPMMISRALLPSSLFVMFPANGPITKSGYAGKIQTGVICEIVKLCVDHLHPCQTRTWMVA